MTRRPRLPHPDQIDLLEWVPEEPVSSFPQTVIRAASLAASIARSISASLKESGRTRAQVASLMSDYLGETVGENILNAYASEARAEHIINVVRFVALIHATGDRRLLQLIAEPFDWVVVERKHVPSIRIAKRDEVIRRLERDNEIDRRLARSRGAGR